MYGGYALSPPSANAALVESLPARRLPAQPLAGQFTCTAVGRPTVAGGAK